MIVAVAVFKLAKEQELSFPHIKGLTFIALSNYLKKSFRHNKSSLALQMSMHENGAMKGYNL